MSSSTVIDKVHLFLSTFAHLDIQTNLSLRSPQCKHSFYPTSLNIGTKTNDEFAAHMAGIAEVIEEFPVMPKQIFYDEGGRIVTVRATSTMKFRAEAMDDGSGDGKGKEQVKWEYDGEYIFVFNFDEEREKIVRIFEMLDSKKVEEVWVLLARAKENLERRRKEGQA